MTLQQVLDYIRGSRDPGELLTIRQTADECRQRAIHQQSPHGGGVGTADVYRPSRVNRGDGPQP